VLEVFTTRSDTLFGVTYVVVAPDHALMGKLVTAATREKVAAFAAEQEKKAAQQKKDEEPEKEGVFTGSYAIHPFTGQKLPVWSANFVVSDYGTGAVMSVPRTTSATSSSPRSTACRSSRSSRPRTDRSRARRISRKPSRTTA